MQNVEAFTFTDSLLNNGVTYETAGSLSGGKRIWLLAKMPEKYIVFSSIHDGTGAVKVAMTPVRVVCQNTLNLALKSSKRKWSTNHVGDINCKLEDAKNTLLLADRYMIALKHKAEDLSMIRLSDSKVMSYVDELIKLPAVSTESQEANILRQREDIKRRYFEAPDLKILPKNAWRFINAVSDFATHSEPLRRTKNYQDNLFMRTIEGLPIVDKALALVA